MATKQTTEKTATVKGAATKAANKRAATVKKKAEEAKATVKEMVETESTGDVIGKEDNSLTEAFQDNFKKAVAIAHNEVVAEHNEKQDDTKQESDNKTAEKDLVKEEIDLGADALFGFRFMEESKHEKHQISQESSTTCKDQPEKSSRLTEDLKGYGVGALLGLGILGAVYGIKVLLNNTDIDL